MKKTAWLLCVLLGCVLSVWSQENKRTIKITKKYLNLPVQHSEDRQQMKFEIGGVNIRTFVIRLSTEEPDYWVFADMSAFQGSSLTIRYPEKVKGMKQIYQSDRFAGEDSVYKEVGRPQVHFSSRRGWNNDPNGLVWYEGEYHLFYQHNPYEANWENMTWGHAVSTDLVFWKELTDVLHPDELGTMFSGTATIDAKNTTGFQEGDNPPIIAAYTAHKYLGEGDAIQTQCIAYSNDKGRTFTKYEGNPVVDSKAKWDSRNTRDPKIFWHEGTQKWVMVVFEKDGHSFYNSDNLKEWTYLSHLVGFWECPELFELPIDGNKYNTKWVIYGASGTYMIGDFDGKSFKPTSGKHAYCAGSLYAAQTYNNIPEEDGRRIQIGWARGMDHGGKMPFTQMFLFPTELTLRSTRNGVRMFSEPIGELKKLHTNSMQWSKLTTGEANEKLADVKGELLHLKLTVETLDGTSFQLKYKGNVILTHDMNYNKLNGVFYESDLAETKTVDLEVLIDRTSVEIFMDHGRFNFSAPLNEPKNQEGLSISGRAEIVIHHLEVHELQSIW
ncbi:MAG: DUF4980 domain-containing protein [Bacteroidota bacterium]